MIDHQEAVRLGIVEKYLLDELSPPQRAEFEEHFFECRECALDLRSTAEFLDTARTELARGTIGGTTARPLERSWLELFWRPAILAPAFALLLAVIVYQNGVVLPRFNAEIGHLRQPHVVSTISLIGANSRGNATPTASGSANRAVLLSLDIAATQEYSSYVCVLVDSTGTPVWRVPVAAAQTQDTVSISIPAGSLQPGDYRLLVQGLTSRGSGGGGGVQPVDLARYKLTLTPAN
jgi:hypothetical protein